MSGTPDRSASTTAGCNSTAAVPLVVTTRAGRPVACPMPSAVNPAERSSRRTWTVMPRWATRARARGADLEPGHTTACVTPARTHSSTTVAAKAAWVSASPLSTGAVGTLIEDPYADPADHLAPPSDPGTRSPPGAGPRVHPDRSPVGHHGRPADLGPPGGPGRHARPR